MAKTDSLFKKKKTFRIYDIETKNGNNQLKVMVQIHSFSISDGSSLKWNSDF